MNRRDFLKTLSLSVAGLVATVGFGRLGHAEEKKKKKADAGGSEGGLCDPTKGKAKEIKYYHSHAEVKDASMKVDKMGVPFEKQLCKNCVLYKADTSTCMLITDSKCTVKPEGICMSWAKSPTAKI